MPMYVPLFSELEKDDSDDGSGPPDAPVVNSRSAAVVNILDES